VRFGLAFGDSVTHARTVEGLDTVSTEALSHVIEAGIDLRYSQVREEAAAALDARGDLTPEDLIWRMVAFGERGQLARIWELLPEMPFPRLVPFVAADPAGTGLPVPADIVELALEAESETERIPFLGIIDAADGFRAIVAIAAGRPAEYEAQLEALSGARERALADGDSTFARRAEAANLLARASRALREEGIDVALPLMRRANDLEPIP
jgi:hypothetical protein